MKEDKRLKWFLVLQAFCPLFILVFIQYVPEIDLIWRFIKGLLHGDWSVFGKVFESPARSNALVALVCLIVCAIAAFTGKAFEDYRCSSFDSHGERIEIETEFTDCGVVFLVNFLLPLLIGDVSTCRGAISFCTLLLMVVLLLWKSDLFYQSPVLAALDYKCFRFRFKLPYNDVEEDRTYIGISKASFPNEDRVIKRKYIADGIFYIDNE